MAMMTEIQNEYKLKDELSGRYWDVRHPVKVEWDAVAKYKRDEQQLNAEEWLVRGAITHLSNLSYDYLLKKYAELVTGTQRIPFRDEWIELFKQQLLK